MKAIIFAAGVGRQLQAVTKGKPKWLVEIGGLPWIEIDFPEDITRAVSQILPAIDTLENTPSTVPVT